MSENKCWFASCEMKRCAPVIRVEARFLIAAFCVALDANKYDRLAPLYTAFSCRRR